MNKALLGSIAVLPLVAAGVLTNTGAANAATIAGTAQFSSAISPLTTVTVDQNSLDFMPDPGPKVVNVGATNGVFSPYQQTQASILYSPLLLGSTLPAQPTFLDFGTLGDDKGIFKLGAVDTAFDFTSAFGLTNGSLGFTGWFIDEAGIEYEGAGTITFQLVGTPAQVQATLASGGKFEDISFSGLTIAITKVPEPTTLAGLGVVAASLAFARTRKKNKAE